MAVQHTKATVVTIDGDNLSAFTKSTTFNRSVDSHDVTTYGKNSKVYSSGLKDGKITLEGFYDTSATGPRAILQPLFDAGTAVEFVFQPEGAGTGKPQNVCDVILTSYNESSPVADYVTFTVELQITGDVDVTPQA